MDLLCTRGGGYSRPRLCPSQPPRTHEALTFSMPRHTIGVTSRHLMTDTGGRLVVSAGFLQYAALKEKNRSTG